MIKTDLISQILDEYKQKRENSALVARTNLNIALSNKDILDLYNKINGLTVDISFCEFNNETKKAKELKKHQETLKLQLEEKLKNINLTPLDLEPKYECGICCDTGFCDGKYCECLKKEISSRLISESNLNFNGASFENANLDIFSGENKQKMQKIYEIMRSFCNNFKNSKIKNFIFSGGTGTGKTYLTQCVASNLIEKGNYVFYTTAFNLSNELLSYHLANLNEKNNILDKYLACDLLIIDDLGVEPIRKNINIEYLLTIISDRAINNRFTIISTNLNPDDILSRYGERIFSRLLDKSQSVFIKFDGEDLRLKRK